MKFPTGAVLTLLATSTVTAGEIRDDTNTIDEVIVIGHEVTGDSIEVAVDQVMLVDASTILKTLPGADVNKNGMLTGIAQYRGLYGDRVAVSIDNHGIVSGGPNAMDAPLSYVSPMITESLRIERGISSVSSAPESIGGHIETGLARGSFGGDDFGVSGFIASRYASNGNINTSAGRLTIANRQHRISMLSEIDQGSDISTPAGVIRPSALDRERYDLSYAFTDGDNHLAVFAGKLRTDDSGTPALPMDIRLIDTDLAGAHFLFAFSPRFSIEGSMAVNDVDHVMDNFALRSAPPPMEQRQNHALGDGRSFTLAGKLNVGDSSLNFGINGITATHDANISNPNNAMFRIANFNNVSRDLTSAFAEWRFDRDASGLELGVRAKKVDANAGLVSYAGIMSPAAAILRDNFNNAQRSLDFDDYDAVAKYHFRQSALIAWQVELATKSRAPSYQELYLWLPMQATGGLADGRTYIGDMRLKAETSNEINIGLNVSSDTISLSPQVYFKQVDDYIQGVPSSNAAANMMSMMMSGQPALQFANTDAEIWGLDLAWGYVLTDRLVLDGTASYVRGKRTDISDDLYRLSPPHGDIGLTFEEDTWSIGARLTAFAKQDYVAAFNDELPTPAYEILDLQFVWKPRENIRLEAAIDNVADTKYQDHLSGINRAADSDIPVGGKLPGAERSLNVGVNLSF